jgi:hypothetical protein
MPWYESKSFSGHWGWHWTMNHFDPDQAGSLASQFHPLIGAYDSSDPDALECQTLEMKVAGVDGVLIDWYGTKDLNDYAILNRNTQKMIDACTKAGLKFSIVLEDGIVPQLIKAGKSTGDGESFLSSALEWMKSRWFNMPGFLHYQGKPVMLMFGPQFYKDQDLNSILGHGQSFFSMLNPRGPAVGAFGWPGPQPGEAQSWVDLAAFYDRAKKWDGFVGIAYPRFEDIYKQAGVGPGYGEIADHDGSTFERTLAMAEAAHPPFIQVATWNDWGEGTQIEPSLEFGYRDLEVLQKHRRRLDPGFKFGSEDLRLPNKLYTLRKAHQSISKLDEAAEDLRQGKCKEAAAILK